MNRPGVVLVIGGTGTTGRPVASLLRARGVAVRVATRSPSPTASDQVRFEWFEPATHAAALDRVDRIYLVAPVGVADPAPVVVPFLARALTTGVRRVVFLSSSAVSADDPGFGEVHRVLRATVPEWTVLRPSWFAQNFVGAHPVAVGIRRRGEILSATGAGRVPFIDASDIAAVAVQALLDEVPHNTDHVITGPEPLGYSDAAAVITTLTGRRVRHRSVDTPTLTSHLVGSGLAPAFAAALARLDESIRRGTEDRVTSTVEEVTGRRSCSFREFVLAHRDEFAAYP